MDKYILLPCRHQTLEQWRKHRKSRSNKKLLSGERYGSEDDLQWREVYGCEDHCRGDKHRSYQLPVVQIGDGENIFPLRLALEYMTELGRYKREQSRSPRRCDASGHYVYQCEAPHCAKSDEYSPENYLSHKTLREKALVAFSGRLFHVLTLWRLYSQRNGRETVRH